MNLRELSQELGLSQTTVSRALNGYPEVSETTRQKVLQAASAHGYHPDAHARGLATGRARTIGHVIPNASKFEMGNVVFADVMAGAGEAFAKSGYDLLTSIVSDDTEHATYRSLSRKRNVDGVFVHSPTMNDPRIELLSELGLPFVVHGRSTEVASPYAYVDVNNKSAIMRATQFLLDLGHRRIGLVNGRETMDFAWRRRMGYLEALAGQGIVADLDLMRTGDMTEPLGFDSAREMLALDDPPSAFVASSIVTAMGLRRAIQDAGLRMGKDVSVICFDDVISYFPNGEGEKIFTALRSPVRAAGRRCAEILIDQIERPHGGLVQELWEAELVLGQSTGPFRAAPKAQATA